MKEQITWRTYAMAVIALTVFALAIALQGGKFGPSDLELYRMAAEPWRQSVLKPPSETPHPVMHGVGLSGREATPRIKPIKQMTAESKQVKDYGADPMGNGMFRMVPSGDIVTREERDNRLGKQRQVKNDCLGMSWEQIGVMQGSPVRFK